MTNYVRRLWNRIEQLESRHMLTTIHVINTVDNGGTTPAVGSLNWAIKAAHDIVTAAQILPPYSNASVTNPLDGISYPLVVNPLTFEPIEIDFSLLSTFHPNVTNIYSIQVNAALRVIDVPVHINGLVGSAVIGGPSTRVILDGNNQGSVVGIRYDGSLYGAAKFIVEDVVIRNFQTAPLTVLKFGPDDTVEIDNVALTDSGMLNGDPGLAILDTPSATGYFHVDNSQIQNNGGAGIYVTDTSANIVDTANRIWGNTITNNGLYATASPYLRAGVSLSYFHRISLIGNTITVGSQLNAVYMQQGLVEVTIDSNILTTVDKSPIALQGYNTTPTNKYRVVGNTFTMSLGTLGSQITPPVDYGDDGTVDLFNPSLPATGPQSDSLNTPVLLTDEISLSSAWQIPFRTRFGAPGDYTVELYKYSSGTWSRVAADGITAPAGDFRGTFLISSSSLSLGDKIAMKATADSGANIGRSSEFSFPTQTTYYQVKNALPALKNVSLGGSSWPTGNAVAIFNGSLGASTMTRPVYLCGPNAGSGVDQIDLTFSKPMQLSSSAVELRYRQGNQFVSVNPMSVTELDTDGNPLTLNYRFTFANRLEPNKYLLRIVEPFVKDLGGQLLDGDLSVNYGSLDNYSDDVVTAIGNQTAGGTAQLRFSVLYGDVNGDGVVDATDKSINGDVNMSGGQPDAADQAAIQAIIDSGGANSRLPAVLRSADFTNSSANTAHPSLPSDDDVIDAKDLQIWKDFFGVTPPVAHGDADIDGDADGADVSIWQVHLGEISVWSGIGAQAAALKSVAGPAAVAPRVTNVIVSGSTSPHAPFAFDSVDGSGLQLRTVPVGGADTISIVFSENVSVSASHLVMIGLRSANMPQLAAFSYNAATFTATWRFTGWALAEQYLLGLSDQVTDADGNWLDGEWTNPASTSTVNAAVSTFPSGNGQGGGWFKFVMTLLPGDANLDNLIDSADYAIFNTYNQWGVFGRTFTQADFDGNGMTHYIGDGNILSTNWGQNLRTLLLLADLDGDFDVDSNDTAIINSNYGATSATRAMGDLNGDGVVTVADLDLAYAQFGLALNVVS